MNFVIQVAAENISAPIDTDFPVLAVVKKSGSFYKFDLYFTTIMDTPTTTEFRVLSLPHKMEEDRLISKELPRSFSTDGFNYHYDTASFANRGLSECIDHILANEITASCSDTEMTSLRIVQGGNLLGENYRIFYIISLTLDTHLKISCPGRKMINNNLMSLVTVIAVSPSCALGLNTQDGTLTVKRNASCNGQVMPSVLLFSYNVPTVKTKDDYQVIFISIISVVLVVLLLFIAGVVYYFWKHKAQVVNIEHIDQITPYNSSDSLATIRACDGRHVSFQNTNV